MVTRRVRRRRSGERGAAMFVVLMVVLILSGIGTFALANARSEMQASGFMRQRNVSQELVDLGGLAVMGEVAKAPHFWVTKARQAAMTGERCKANAGLPVTPPPPCYHVYVHDYEALNNLTTERMFRPATATVPGSLGLATTTGGFDVEITNPMNVTRPVPGAPIDGRPGTPVFLDVTLTSTGVVFNDTNGNGRIDISAGEASNAVFSSGRGHVILGPITAPM